MSVSITLFVLSLVALCFCSVANAVAGAFEDNIKPKVADVVKKVLSVVAQIAIAVATVALFAEVVVQLL